MSTFCLLLAGDKRRITVSKNTFAFTRNSTLNSAKMSLDTNVSSHYFIHLSQSHSSSSLSELSSPCGSGIWIVSMSLMATMSRFNCWFSSRPARAISGFSSGLCSAWNQRHKNIWITFLPRHCFWNSIVSIGVPAFTRRLMVKIMFLYPMRML